MKPRVYLETTIVSYLTAWPSRDVVRAGHQRLTREWWQQDRERFEVFISQLVTQECARGDADAARERLAFLAELPELDITDGAKQLAKDLVRGVPLPTNAEADAFHIAVAVANGMDYLLTWNCRHIANATLRFRIESVCRDADFEPCIICTPEQLRAEES